MTNIEKKLTGMGLKVWEKGNLRRIYINPGRLGEIYGLKIEYYHTGNVKHASVQGEKISNAEALRILSDKLFFDCVAGEWRGRIEPLPEFRDVAEIAENGAASADIQSAAPAAVANNDMPGVVF